MRFDIFQVDWISVDIVIIILLIVLLIGVKVFKELYRWRFFSSNTSTIQYPYQHARTSPDFIKSYSLTTSTVYQQESLKKPTIIIIRRYRKHMLLKTLTEAFCSYGYLVINIKLKTFSSYYKVCPSLEDDAKLSHTFSNIINFFNQSDFNLSQKYILIEFNKEVLPYNLLLKDLSCKNLILINPRLTDYNIERLKFLIDDSDRLPELITIFSEKLNPIFKNKRKINNFLGNKSLKNTKHNILNQARSTFKYYETVLLSVLIGYIEK